MRFLILIGLGLFTGCVWRPRESGEVAAAPSLLSTALVRAEVVTHSPTAQVLEVKDPFTIVVYRNQAEMRKYLHVIGVKTNGVTAYCETEARILHVPLSPDRDVKNRYLPDFESLGHELWHLNELGGWWHIAPVSKPAVVKK